MIHSLVFVFTSLVNTYAIYLFSKGLFGDYQKSKKMMYISYGGYYVLSTAIYILFAIPMLNTLINIIMCFILSIGYAQKLRSRILYTVVIVAYLICTDLVSVAIGGLRKIDVFNKTDYSSEIGLVLVCLIMLLIARMVSFRSYHKSEIQIPVKVWMFLVLVTISIAFISVALMTLTISRELLVVCLILLLAINCAIYYLYDAIIDRMNQAAEMDLVKQQGKYYQHEFELMQESEKQIEILRHDMKNQIIHLQALLRDGEYADLSVCMAELLGNVQSYSGIKSGNKIIDCILNYKMTQILSERIDFHYDIVVPTQLDIKDFDLISLLGNMIDNAIEASLKEPMDAREIELSITLQYNILVLRIRNYCSKLPAKLELENLKTSKLNKKLHGKGMLSIKQIAENYSGSVRVEKICKQEKEYFEMECVLLCCQ